MPGDRGGAEHGHECVGALERDPQALGRGRVVAGAIPGEGIADDVEELALEPAPLVDDGGPDRSMGHPRRGVDEAWMSRGMPPEAGSSWRQGEWNGPG